MKIPISNNIDIRSVPEAIAKLESANLHIKAHGMTKKIVLYKTSIFIILSESVCSP